MKYIMLVVAGAMMVTVMSSCQRNYTCTCVFPGKAAGTTRTEIKAYNRSDAAATCSSWNDGAKLNGGACSL